MLLTSVVARQGKTLLGNLLELGVGVGDVKIGVLEPDCTKRGRGRKGIRIPRSKAPLAVKPRPPTLDEPVKGKTRDDGRDRKGSVAGSDVVGRSGRGRVGGRDERLRQLRAANVREAEVSQKLLDRSGSKWARRRTRRPL